MNRSLQSLFAMAMAVALPLTLFAQTKDAITTCVKVDFQTPAPKPPIERVKTTTTQPQTKQSKAEQVQAGTKKVLEKLRNAYSYYAQNSPYVYDEGTNAYFRVQRGSDDQTLGNLYLITSTDKGNTWSAPSQYYAATLEGQGRYPSVQVHNKNKSSNLADISYVFYAPVLRPKGSSDARFDGAVFGFQSGNGTSDMFFYPAPETGNPDNQKWSTSTDWVTDQSKPISYMAQTLYSLGAGGSNLGQYGQYGFIAINPDVIESQVPSKWGLSVFRPSTAIDRSYNDRPNLGIDSEGTIYALFANFFADDESNRVPAVSKSADGGKTWSDFERMPATLLTDYFTSNGGTTANSGIVAYGTQGFQVLGKDTYSYVFRVSIDDADAGTPAAFHIVEAYRANGSWGIRKIADYSGSVPSVIYESSVPGTDTAAASNLDNEIQYVRTADGNLLVKYLDFVTHNFAGEDRDISDIFVAARKIDGTSWSAPQNITNDAFFDKLSWIPSSLPNLQDIPMIQMRTTSTLDETTLDYLQAQRHIDDEQEIVQTSFTVSTVGVEEEPNPAGLALYEAYPNPASGSVELPFSVERAVDTKIELYTVLGEKVAMVQSGLTAPGFHAIVLNTENIAAGTYYYTLTAGTVKLTKMLSVVR